MTCTFTSFLSVLSLRPKENTVHCRSFETLRMQSYDEGVKCFNYDNSLYLSKSSVISYIRPLHIFSSISIVITDCDIETDKIILLEG